MESGDSEIRFVGIPMLSDSVCKVSGVSEFLRSGHGFSKQNKSEIELLVGSFVCVLRPESISCLLQQSSDTIVS